MRTYSSAVLLSACAAITTSTAFAQSAAEPGSGVSALEEVVVTARKREESIMDVPLAVTAVSGETLAAARVLNVEGLTTQVPSLLISPGLGANRTIPTFSIRGLSQQELTILADPSVTTYFGDIVYARAQGINAALFDIGSVEVLKGPQGTLFGRNVTGGAILIKPNLPERDLKGAVGLTVGNFGTRDADAMVNVPLGERAQLRVAGAYAERDGYIKDILLGKDVNDVKTKAGRLSLAVQPIDALNTVFVVNAFDEDDGATGTFINRVNPTGTVCTAAAALGWGNCQQLIADQRTRGMYKIASGAPQYTKVQTWDAANTTTYQFTDSLSFKSVIGYRSVESDVYEDTDGTPWPILSIQRIDDLEQKSAELQLLGSNGRLEWIVGGYYFNEEGDNQGISMTAQREPAPGAATNLSPEPLPRAFPAWSNTWVAGENTSYAAFAQGTLGFTDRLSMTVGARYTWDKREAVIKNDAGIAGGIVTSCRFTRDLDGNPATPEVNPGVAGCALPVEADFGEPTWTVSLEYRPVNDALVYLAHRRGYRSGGFGARAGTERGLRRTFEPETVSDIELGTKVDWHFADMLLRTNLAVYYSDYKDIQRLLTDPNTTPVTTVTTNAGAAEIKGAELELTFIPIDNLRISGWYSYTDAKFTDFIAPDGRDLSVFPFARAPKNSGSASVQYTFPLGSAGDLRIGGSYWFTDEFSASDDFNPTVMVDGYKLVNFNAAWANVMGTPLDVSLFVNNATQEEYNRSILNIYTSLGFDARTPGEPRTYGVQLRYRFGEK